MRLQQVLVRVGVTHPAAKVRRGILCGGPEHAMAVRAGDTGGGPGRIVGSNHDVASVLAAGGNRRD